MERRHQHAMRLLNKGYEPVNVAVIIGVDRISVRRWKASYRKTGENSIIAVPAPGRPPKFTGKHLKKLEKTLLKGSKAAGFPTDLWAYPPGDRVI